MANTITVDLPVDAAKRIEQALTHDLHGHQNRLVDYVRYYSRASTPADEERHLSNAVRAAEAAQQVVDDRAHIVRALQAADQF